MQNNFIETQELGVVLSHTFPVWKIVLMEFAVSETFIGTSKVISRRNDRKSDFGTFQVDLDGNEITPCYINEVRFIEF